MKLGGGGRFAALKSKLSRRPGVDDPGALAASIGRRKYGAAKLSAMAAKGRAAHGGMTHEVEPIIAHADVMRAHRGAC